MRKAISIACIFTLVSCKKFVEIPPPDTQLVTSWLFSDDESAKAAVTGLYSRMAAANMDISNGGMTLYPGLSADELENTSANSNMDSFRENNLLPGTGALAISFWNPAYRNIYHCNAVLSGLANATGLTDTVKTQLRGEMLYLRAFNYFNLVSLFGEVPLLLTTNFEANAIQPRTPLPQVYARIVTDLEEAGQTLPQQYATVARTRPNKFAALALLARVNLYREEYAKAEQRSSLIISNSVRYDLEPLDKVFQSQASKETIWQLARENNNTAEALAFLPFNTATRPAYILTPSLLNSFETGDNRRTAWTMTQVVNGQSYTFPFKYKARHSAPVTEFYTMQRLAELFLIRAEARVMQNNTAGALEDLNRVRARAGLSSLNYTGNDDLLDAIQQERRVELFCEWGHRWLDLKRTGKADAVLSVIKGAGWQPTDKRYPIPQNEINLNPYLVQNPGY